MPVGGIRMDSWTEGLTTRERIRKIALTLTHPRSVNWIKREADVASWDTTKDELERLVEAGQIKRIDDKEQDTYQYGPNYRRRYLDQIEELTVEHSKEDLRDELAAIQDQIEAWKETYGVADRDELEASLTGDELSSEELRERNKVIRRWEQSESTKRLIDHALSLYDDLERIDDTASGTAPNPVTQS